MKLKEQDPHQSASTVFTQKKIRNQSADPKMNFQFWRRALD